MDHLNPNVNRSESFPAVSQSQVTQGVYLKAPAASQKIHYMTVPLRFTYYTSPNASQTRPLEVRFHQLQSYNIMQSQFKNSRFAQKARRNRIFGDQHMIEDFTPRRRIYVQSKQSISPLLDFNLQMQDVKKQTINHTQQHHHDQQSKLQQYESKEQHQQSLQNTEKQINQSYDGNTQGPVPIAQNKSTQSYTQPLRRYFHQDLDIDEMMSVELEERREFGQQVGFSPIGAPPPYPIPLDEPVVFEEPSMQVPISRELQFNQPNSQILTSSKLQEDYWRHKILFALIFSYVVFQLIK